jgi:DNA polymerase I
LEQERPDYLAVAFDTGKTFRDKLYPEYKGTRAKMPDDLRPQIERVRQIVDAFNVPRLEMDNYEADDVLGSVARKAVAQGLGVKIITGDRDLLQLVDDRIIVNLPGKTLSEARDFFARDVVEYLGVRPDQVVDYKALVGDKSDNIPGVAGIGEKTAISLLDAYGNLEGVYAHLDEISGSVRTKLEKGRQDATLSYELAAIVTDLDVPLNLEQARPEHFDPAKVEEIFRQLEFRTLMPRLQSIKQRLGLVTATRQEQLSLFDRVEPRLETSQPTQDEGAAHTRIVDTAQALAELVRVLKNASRISFDTETTSTSQMLAELVGISLAVDGQKGYYIPVGHLPEMGTQLPLETVVEALKDPLSDPAIPKVGHNLKYDLIVLNRYGLRVSPLSFDSMIAEWLCNPDSRNLGLKNLSWVRLDHRMTEIDELIGKGRNQKTMAEVPIQQAAQYAGDDAAVVLRLIPQLEAELEQSSGNAAF